MGRDPRYIPPNSLQHVVDVVFQNRFLLCPSTIVNERFLGVLGRAQKKYDMPICAVVVLSNHVHYLLRPRDGAHLATFMCFLKTNLAKEIGGRLRGWKRHFFDHRYHSTTVSEEQAAQIAVLRYVLSNGPKEFLVDTVIQWPGVHSAIPTIEGRDMIGRWIDRTATFNARIRQGETEIDTEDFASEERVEISPLPCWQHLPEADWRRAVADLVEEIDREVALKREELGRTSLGVTKILTADPLHCPDQVERSPKPRFHAFDAQVLKAMIEIWREVIRCFREASEKLRRGILDAEFPEGTFPPALAFVPFSTETVSGMGRGQPL